MIQLFGDNLKRARKAKNFTQKDLASLLGVSDNGISNWEKGVSRPDIDQVARICQILEVNPAELITPDLVRDVITPSEKEMIEKFNQLDFYGKKVVTTVIDIEFERCKGSTIKIAARNGEFKEITVTDDEKNELIKSYDSLPDVPE